MTLKQLIPIIKWLAAGGGFGIAASVIVAYFTSLKPAKVIFIPVKLHNKTDIGSVVWGNLFPANNFELYFKFKAINKGARAGIIESIEVQANPSEFNNFRLNVSTELYENKKVLQEGVVIEKAPRIFQVKIELIPKVDRPSNISEEASKQFWQELLLAKESDNNLIIKYTASNGLFDRNKNRTFKINKPLEGFAGLLNGRVSTLEKANSENRNAIALEYRELINKYS